jgi:hypothetical protein
MSRGVSNTKERSRNVIRFRSRTSRTIIREPIHADDRLYVVKKSFPSPGLYRGILKRFHYATSTYEAVREDGR